MDVRATYVRTYVHTHTHARTHARCMTRASFGENFQRTSKMWNGKSILAASLLLVRLLTTTKISPGCDHCLCKRRPQNVRAAPWPPLVADTAGGCRRFRGPINGVSCGRQTSFRRWRGVKRWPACPFSPIT